MTFEPKRLDSKSRAGFHLPPASRPLAMALSQKQTWKNTRKRSLYVEEGLAGFIFYRKSKNPRERDEKQPTPPQEKTVVDTHIDIHTVSEEDEATEMEVGPLSQKQLDRIVEVKKCVDDIKREIHLKKLDIPDEKVEKMCSGLYEDLRSDIISGSDVYIQYLEAGNDEENLPPHPLEEQLSESIRQLQQKIEVCEREAEEWGRLVETKKTEAQTTKQDLESNLNVDWSNLRPEDEAKLLTHLSPEQRGWLESATSERNDMEWIKNTEQHLTTLSSRIDEELQRIQTYCDNVLKQCAEDTSKLDTDLPTQTPRTLFRALKDTD